ncbi:MAG: hypothetical protein H7Y11_02325, partial [Armatimonadetes bacterium]|nr:hypothetical protein [Anaerolineae bacterium]
MTDTLPRRALPLPPALTLAADARLSRVNYTDDQAWELLPGVLDSPGLALQTRYGGRVGLASLVPMWTLLHDRRVIYEAQAYATPPVITAFAPGCARVEAALLPTLTLIAEVWVLESCALGVRYTLHNTAPEPVALRLDLFAQVGSHGKAQTLAIATLVSGLQALALGKYSHLTPAVLLENATAQLGSGSPKIGVDLTIAPGETLRVRWVHAGAAELRDSLALAEAWLAQDWDAGLARVAQAAQALPMIETGDPAHDAV